MQNGKVLVLYYSTNDNIETMAHAVAEGCENRADGVGGCGENAYRKTMQAEAFLKAGENAKCPGYAAGAGGL